MSGNINFNGWINDDGSENYKCRAWVNFNGTGTVAIRAAGNVSSITDNGTGDYTVNFTTAMVDANYCTTGMAGRPLETNVARYITMTTPQTSSVRVQTSYSASNVIDVDFVSVAIFR